MLQNKIGITPAHVDEMLAEQLDNEDLLLKSIRETCREQGLPEIEVSVEQGKLLELLVAIARPQLALEIGTLGGYSTICMARGLRPGGQVITIEYDHHHFEVAKANFRKSGYSDRIRGYYGDALEVLKKIRSTSFAFDFVFIDADKERNADYLQWAVDWCVPGATIVVDNVIRDGRVLDPERPEKLEFINLVGTLLDCGRLEATVVQTVGAKGWDGFMLGRKL